MIENILALQEKKREREQKQKKSNEHRNRSDENIVKKKMYPSSHHKHHHKDENEVEDDKDKQLINKRKEKEKDKDKDRELEKEKRNKIEDGDKLFFDNDFFIFPASDKPPVWKRVTQHELDNYIELSDFGRMVEKHQIKNGVKLTYNLEYCKVDITASIAFRCKQNSLKSFTYLVGLQRKIDKQNKFLPRPYYLGTLQCNKNIITAHASIYLQELIKGEQLSIILKLFKENKIQEQQQQHQSPLQQVIEQNADSIHSLKQLNPEKNDSLQNNVEQVPGEKEEEHIEYTVYQWNISVDGDVFSFSS